MKNIDSQLMQFCSTDQSRELMLAPWIDGENVIATDAHVLVVAPKSYINGNYDQCEGKYPAYKKVIPPHDKETIITIPYRRLLDELLILPSEDVYEKCELCEGVGQLTTKKTYNTVDCPECDGHGTEDLIGNFIPTPMDYEENESACYVVKIQNVYFNPNLLLKTCRLAALLEVDLQFVRFSDTSACIVYLNDIMVLIMPYAKPNGDGLWEDVSNVIVIDTI